ncbi:MAG: efflux RND transporter periplasmic adaptor subunit [Lachnospiraceae bacterium]|nr:efflux RND transporter periplasmic adaptor subunit [Lachnospiraceae bacterium]
MNLLKKLSVNVNKKKLGILSGVVALSVVAGVVSVNAGTSMKVRSYTVASGDLAQYTELNGNIVSDTVREYYSRVDSRIGKVLVKEGDYVKKGDLLISYDEEDLKLKTELAKANASSKDESLNGRLSADSRMAGMYAEASSAMSSLDNDIAMYQAEIDRLDAQIISAKAALANEGARLQVSLIDHADDKANADLDDNDILSDNYNRIQKDIQYNAYEQNYNSQILSMEQLKNEYSVLLADCKQRRSEMFSQKNSTFSSLMTDKDKEALELERTSYELTNEDIMHDLEVAAEGIKADFDGIVTEINTAEDVRVSTGMKLLTLESSDDIAVKFNVNKYDIDALSEGQEANVKIRSKNYTGKVSRIDRMTGRGSSDSANVGVEIKLDEPDSDIILGLEAKAFVNTAALNNVLTVAVDALCEEEEGTFVFVARDGKAVKVPVVTGVKNEDVVEIVSGLSEGDIAIWNDTEELTDGMSIRFENKGASDR